MKRTLSLVALGLALALNSPAQAPAQNVGSTTNDDLPQAYGRYSITNGTGMTIRYSRQWGNTGAWREITLLPGTTETHSHLLDRAGRAPTPYVGFYSLVGNQQQLPVPSTRKHQRMSFFRVIEGGYGPAANPGRPKPYRFVLSSDGRTLSLRAMP